MGPVITELESLTGVETRRIHVDRGYRGHNHRHKFRVWITGQVRRVTRPIRREMKRRAAFRRRLWWPLDDNYIGRLGFAEAEVIKVPPAIAGGTLNVRQAGH